VSERPLLEVQNLTKLYLTRSAWPRPMRHEVRAVDDVSLAVRPGETFGLVGESGCGKSTIARCVLRLIAPTSGSVRFDGRDLLALPPEQMRELRREMQIIFQDPYSSLDPRMRVQALVAEPLEIHAVGTRETRARRVTELLERVGLGEGALSKFPHEFSGGQRQRIGIARALALSPRLVIADEPVSALDLSVRAQVINLLMELQRDFSLTYLFIAHDLALVRRICDRVAVMQRGRIVEQARAIDLFADPRHPYTRSLLAAVPEPDPRRRIDRRSSSDDRKSASERPAGVDGLLREVAPEHWVLSHEEEGR
jgi:oligopeptide transport system ATP-binding protein